GFVITVTNTGAGTAHGVTVNDTLPDNGGLNWAIDVAGSDTGCSIGSGSLTCNFGDVGSQSSKHVHITSPTTASSCGTVDNTATVTTSNDGGDEASDSITVRCPAIDIVKTVNDSDKIVSRGQTLTHSLALTVSDG